MAKLSRVIRCRGDTTMSSADGGAITVHLSRCNMTSQNDSVISQGNYDSAGALRFTVTVVMVYGVAVVGVFALGLLKRKRPSRATEDKEAQSFMKDYDNVRRTFEQKSRVGAISTLLHHIHSRPDQDTPTIQREGLMNNLAFLALPLAKIAEQDETQEEEEDREEKEKTSSKTQSIDSTDSSENPFSFCVMCASPLDKHDGSGPLCDNCVNKYRNTILSPFERYSLNDDFDGLTHGVPSSSGDCYTQRPGEIQNLDDDVFLSESGDEYYDVELEIKPLC